MLTDKNKMSILFKRSQAAVEFLMTYGWAILVILVAIGALANFGVLSPGQFLPSKCALPAGIICVDFNVGASKVDVVLRNGLGFDLGDVKIAVSGCTDSPTTNLNNGAQDTFTATSCGLSSGSKFSGNINVTYTNIDTTRTHKVLGSLRGKVE